MTGVTSSVADFIVPRVSSFPLVVAAGDSVELPIRFQPRSRGAGGGDDHDRPATIRRARRRSGVSGTAPSPRLVVSIADAGDFGDVCVGAFSATSRSR